MEGGVLEVPIEDAGGGQAHVGDCWRLYPHRQSRKIGNPRKLDKLSQPQLTFFTVVL